MTSDSPDSPSPSIPIAEAKRAARLRAKAARDALDPTGAGGDLADIFFREFPDLPKGAAIAGYWPKGSEMDVRPLLNRLVRAGHSVGLPVVLGKGRPLLFRRWSPGQPLSAGAFGILEPVPPAPEIRPDLLLVPLLAFDRSGRRLGYGAGFYDRTLAILREGGGSVTALGVGYAAQEVDLVPCDVYDAPLDGIVTERGSIRVEKG